MAVIYNGTCYCTADFGAQFVVVLFCYVHIYVFRYGALLALKKKNTAKQINRLCGEKCL